MESATCGKIRNLLTWFKEPTSSEMVPSRSIKTAGRRVLVSVRAHLYRRNPVTHGGFDSVGSNAGHAAVIRRAAAQKTWAAVRFFLNDAATRRDGCSAEWIGRPKDSHDGETNGGGDVHRAGIVANEQMALRK